MVQYLLSVHSTDTDPEPSPEVMERAYAQVDKFNEEIKASGNWVFGGGLHPVSTATVVDATGAEVVTTDGPFAESKEHLAGFWIVQAGDLDQALELARRGSEACGGPVEVRPFQDDPGA
jgi:hypothetical protein